MFDSPEYSWYHDVVSIETDTKDKPDYRIMPKKHSDSIVCRCSAYLDTNDFKQIECKWYVKSDYHDSCKYDRWGIMCDKLTDSDEKGVN